MEFGIGFGQDIAITEAAAYARQVEDAGFNHATFIDLGNLSADIHVALTVAALATKKIWIGHGVTDPVTFPPADIANAIATIRELAGDRVFAGLGAGGPYGKPFVRAARVEEVGDTIRFIRDYTAGKDATYGENTWHNEWIRRSRFAGRSMAVMVAAAGPKMCHMAGQLSDGIFSIGLEPALQNWRKEIVERGAASVGRDPGKIEYWIRSMIYVADSKKDAFDELAPYAAVNAWELWRVLQTRTPETMDLAKRIETAHPGMLKEFEAISDSWDPYMTERIGGPQTAPVTQRMVDFFAASGTPDDIAEQLAPFDRPDIKGVSSVTFAIRDLHSMIDTIAREILPRYAPARN